MDCTLLLFSSFFFFCAVPFFFFASRVQFDFGLSDTVVASAYARREVADPEARSASIGHRNAASELTCTLDIKRPANSEGHTRAVI